MRLNNRGVALITVLLVVALVSVLASQAVWQQHLAVRRSTNVLMQQQAMFYHLGAETWVKQWLKTEIPAQIKGVYRLPSTPITGGKIQAQLSVQEARYNLNNLLLDDGQASVLDIAYLQRLFKQLDLPSAWVMLLVDWLDADQTVLPDGAEDGHYLLAQPAYRTADQLLSSLSELWLILPMTLAHYQSLQTHVCVLPQRTKINLNLAPAALLLALDQQVTVYQADYLIRQRKQQPFSQLTEVSKAVQDFPREHLADFFGFDRQFFSLSTDVSLNDISFHGTSLVQKAGQQMRIIQRQL
jgi:general secretion pathway protein K